MTHKREQCQSSAPSLSTVSLASTVAYTPIPSISSVPQTPTNRQVGRGKGNQNGIKKKSAESLKSILLLLLLLFCY